MISNGKQLYDFIDSILKPAGFVKKKDVWYRSSIECIVYYYMRKSEFGGYYECSMGCFLKEPGVGEYPRPAQRYLFYPLNYFLDKQALRQLFHLEYTGFRGDEREHAIAALLHNYVLPFLSDVSTRDGIKTSLDKYKEIKYYMTAKLVEALNLQFD